MGEHTPGPWTAKWSKYRDGVFIVQAGMPSNRVLAQFDGDGDGPDEQSIADARLIAAAPDMLDALQQALLYIETDEIAHGRQFGDGNVVRAAIAKAEGGAS